MTRRAHRALSFSLLAALVGVVGGCNGGGGGSSPSGDAGMAESVMYDQTYSATCLGPLTCDPSAQVQSACTCIITPRTGDTYATRRTGCSQLMTAGSSGGPRTHDKDFCDESANGTAPNLSCFMPGMYEPQATSQMVTFYGTVDVFGNGGDADGITVAVYKEGADGNLGDMVGMAISDVTDSCAESEDQINHDMVVGTRKLGFFAIPNVPTETPLIVETSGDANFWKPLYTYNVYIYNRDVVTDPPPSGACTPPAGPDYRYEAKTLSRSDYESIPLTAGLSSGISSGNGALAGEVHDCDNVRLDYVQIGVSPAPAVTTYFNDDPDNPLPDMGCRDGTSLLGLYAAIDIPAGPVDVSAVGRVDGNLVSLGWYRARIFPNAVTVVTLRGLRPQQTTTQP